MKEKQEKLTAKMNFKSHAAFTLHMCIGLYKVHICIKGPTFTFLLTKLEMKAFGILDRIIVVRIIR